MSPAILHLHPAGRFRIAPGQALPTTYDEDAETFASDAAALGLPVPVLPEGASEAWRSDGRTVVIAATGQDEGPPTWAEADLVLQHADQLAARAATRAAAQVATAAAVQRDQEAAQAASRQQREAAETERLAEQSAAEEERQAEMAEQARIRQAAEAARQEAAAAQEAIDKRRLTPFAFRQRLSLQTRQAITMAASRALDAGEPALQTALDDLTSASVVELDRDDVREYVGLLQFMELITAEQAEALLADSLPEERP